MKVPHFVFLLLSLLALSLGVQYKGVNQAGAEFGALPGILNTDYTWPTAFSIDWFMTRKVNVFRIPFVWERIQPVLGTFPLDAAYAGNLDHTVNYITSKGGYALIDVHNYFRYNGQIIGSGAVSFDSFWSLWTNLAIRYINNPNVIFGLMNEPYGVPTEDVLTAMQGAINAIRRTGSRHLILVPGNAWCAGSSWFENWYGTPNADVMSRINDPGNNFAYDIHQYLDFDHSGTHDSCDRNWNPLPPLTNWLKQMGRRAFLSEVGWGANGDCYNAASNILSHMNDNSDVWLGWTYWSAGPWWGDYFLTVEPKPDGSSGGPQWDNVLANFLGSGTNGGNVGCLPAGKQCGGFIDEKGTRYSGPTCCQSGLSCTSLNQWYAECRTSGASPAPPPPPPPPPSNCAGQWQQCGGSGWNGPTCCSSGTCTTQNPWYSQCM